MIIGARTGTPLRISGLNRAEKSPLRNAAGNQNYLSAQGETYRWQQESAVVAKGTPAGSLPGLIDAGIFAAEVSGYAKAGIFPNGAPSTDGTYDADVATGVVSGLNLIWPASGG